MEPWTYVRKTVAVNAKVFAISIFD